MSSEELTFEQLRQECLDAEAMLHVSDEGVVLRVEGRAATWVGEGAVGTSLGSLFGEGEAFEDRLRVGRLAAEELRLTMRDGRRVALSISPCRGGWLVRLIDVTAHRVLGEAIAQRERMEALGGLSSAVARELNDPMSIVQGRLELLLELGVVDAESTQHHLRVALDHARRISATLRNLRMVGRRSERRLQRVELNAVVEDALGFLGPRGARVECVIQPPDLAAGGDPAMYARVLANTLRQTIEGAARGTVFLRAKREGRVIKVRVDVGRHGRGEPLVGQDLSIDETLLRSVGGQLSGQRVGGAPTFELTLPLPPAIRGRARPVDTSMLVVGGDRFSDTVQSLLDKDGFDFRWASSAEEALDGLGEAPDVVLSELLLPGGISGLGLAKELTRMHPELGGMVLVVTDGPIPAFPDPVVAVPKPLSRARLLDAMGRRVRRN